jgi:hypothetical protein
MVAMLTAHAVADIPPMEGDIPPPVEALVRAGLAKSPGDRIPTAAAYVARIDEMLGRPPSIHSGVHAIASPFTPPPGQIHSIAPPRDLKKIAMWVGGGILAVGLLAAIVSGLSSTESKSASKPSVQAPKPKPAAAPVDAAPAKPPPPEPLAPPSDAYNAAIKQLTKGKTCPLRKAAVAQLVELGDPRAIPVLKKARNRMRGGILGIGDSNTNSCLKADAEAAIKKLGG